MSITDTGVVSICKLRFFGVGDGAGPLEGICCAAPLDVGEGVIQLLRGLSDLHVVDDILLLFVGQHANGRDDGSGTAAPALLQTAVLGGLQHFFCADQTLFHFHTPALQHLDAGVAGDPGQDGAVQGGGDYLAVDLEHNVHGAAFFDVLALHTVQP